MMFRASHRLRLSGSNRNPLAAEPGDRLYYFRSLYSVRMPATDDEFHLPVQINTDFAGEHYFP